jgi:CBS domain-containing protein
MSAGRICIREVDLINPTESVQTAAGRMHACQVGTLVVVDNGKRPVGIITDRDITVRVVAAGKDVCTTPVRDAMTECPQTIREATPIEDALKIMRTGRFRRLPVVNSEDRLAGILCLDDVLDLLAEEFTDIGRLIRAEQPRALACACD